MWQFLVFTLVTILFEKTLGEPHKYSPEIFNIALQSGVKYHVVRDVNKCPEKALIEQEVSIHLSVGFIDGENVKFIGRSNNTLTMIVGTANIGSKGKLKEGCFNRVS